MRKFTFNTQDKFITNPAFESFKAQWCNADFVLFRNAYDSCEIKNLGKVFDMDSLFPVMRTKYSEIDKRENEFLQWGMFQNICSKDIQWVDGCKNVVIINGYMFEVIFSAVPAERIDFPVFVTEFAKRTRDVITLDKPIYTFISLNLIKKV